MKKSLAAVFLAASLAACSVQADKDYKVSSCTADGQTASHTFRLITDPKPGVDPQKTLDRFWNHVVSRVTGEQLVGEVGWHVVEMNIETALDELGLQPGELQVVGPPYEPQVGPPACTPSTPNP